MANRISFVQTKDLVTAIDKLIKQLDKVKVITARKIGSSETKELAATEEGALKVELTATDSGALKVKLLQDPLFETHVANSFIHQDRRQHKQLTIRDSGIAFRVQDRSGADIVEVYQSSVQFSRVAKAQSMVVYDYLSIPNIVNVNRLTNVIEMLQSPTAPPPVVGSNVALLSTVQSFSKGDFSKDDTTTSTAGTGFVTKLSHSFNVDSSSDYLIEWYGEAYGNKTDVNIQVVVDGTTIIAENVITKNIEYLGFMGIDHLTFSQGTHIIEIQFESAKNGKTSSVRRARIYTRRLT